MTEVIRVYQHHNNKLASMVQVQCDTDFVARNEEFLKFVDNLAMGIASIDDKWDFLYEENPVTGQLFMEDILDARKKFGEDIRLTASNKFEVWENDEEIFTMAKKVHLNK